MKKYFLFFAFLCVANFFPQEVFSQESVEKWLDSETEMLNDEESLKKLLEESPDTKGIHIWYDEFTEIPEYMFKFKNLERLEISSANLKSLKGIEKFPNLKYLDISFSGENIKSLPAELVKLPLIFLDLGSLELGEEWSKIVQIKTLRGLKATTDKFKNLNGLEQLQNLEELTIGSIFWVPESAPQGLGKLQKLKVLEIRGIDKKYYDALAQSIKQLKELESLDLTLNQLADASFVQDLSKLKILSINPFFENEEAKPIGAWLGKLSNLEKLDLNGFNIDAEGLKAFAKLTKLEEVTFNSLKLNAFPAFAPSLKSLTLLSVAFENGFPKIAKPEQYTNLDNLYLDGVAMTEVPAEFGKFPNLERLKISDAGLTKFNSKLLATLPNLKRLDLSTNKLDQLDEASYKDATKISQLNFSNNPLSSIPLSWFQAKDLYHVYLSQTQIANLPAGLKDVKYSRYDNKITIEVTETPMAEKMEQLGKDFPNVEFSTF